MCIRDSVRTVQVHIHNLRSKIEPDPAKPIYLKNVWGKGYIFRPEGETEAWNGFAVLNIVNPQSTRFLRKLKPWVLFSALIWPLFIKQSGKQEFPSEETEKMFKNS